MDAIDNVSYVIRDITTDDLGLLDQAAVLHERSFPSGLIAALGREFVVAYHRFLSESPTCGLLAALEGDEVLGYVAYSLDNFVVRESPLFQNAKRRLLVNLLTFRIHPVIILRGMIKKAKGREVYGMPELMAIVVKSEYRRAGIGGQLMARMEERLLDNGFRKYCVFTDNREGLNFYQKQALQSVFRFRLAGVESACFVKEITR